MLPHAPSKDELVMLKSEINNHIENLKRREKFSKDYLATFLNFINQFDKSHDDVKPLIEKLQAAIKASRNGTVKLAIGQKTIEIYPKKELKARINWVTHAQGRKPYPSCEDKNYFRNERNPDRFDREGLYSISTEYKWALTWDLKPITVGILIPKDIDPTKDMPVHVKWHGGGFTTQKWEFEPWFAKSVLEHAKAKNAIILAPNYRLMPEACGKDILQDVVDFWKWYMGDEFMYQLKKDIPEKMPGHGDKLLQHLTNIRRKLLLVSGESAGGFLAVYSWLKSPDLGLKVGTLFLQYPMLRYYSQDWSDDSPKSRTGNTPIERRYGQFMGTRYTLGEAFAAGGDLLKLVEGLRKIDRCPTKTGATAPDRICGGNTLSRTKLWQKVFQTSVDKTHGTQDIIGMLECMMEDNRMGDEVKLKEPTHFPPIIIYHGHNDPNCPVQDVFTFIEKCQKRWSQHYPGDDKNKRIFLEEIKFVTKFDENGLAFTTDDVGHGFDHDLVENQEPFLARSMARINHFWPSASDAARGGNSAENIEKSVLTTENVKTATEYAVDQLKRWKLEALLEYV